MAIAEWWDGEPSERFWLEITDRDDLGADLYAPKTDQSGNETWSYALVSHVRPGDVVFHYWKQPGQEKAIVGFSQVTGSLEETTIRWQAHGTVGRAAGTATSRPAWRFPLTEFTDLADPVTLDDLRALETTLRKETKALADAIPGPHYLPFVFSDKRPLRTAQGYLTKLPAAFVAAIPGLDQALAIPTRQEPGAPPKPTPRGIGYLQDQVLKKALERHAVDWTLAHFEALGYLVDDVGGTNPYDVLALGDEEELRIEVKGSSGTGTTVELTAGEVNEAQAETGAEPVLVVVDQIRWERTSSGKIETSGGRVRIWRGWEPADERLTPTSFRYLLPPGAELADL